LFDEEGTGKISFKNLKKIAQEIGNLFENFLTIGETLTDEELYEMLEEADRDNDGMINPDEFFR
jgi:centrin-1